MTRPSWRSDAIPLLVAYPNVKRVGASSLGLQVIESIGKDDPRYVVDRFYLPARGKSTQPVSEVYATPPRVFSLVGFSCAFEPDYFNVVEMLRLAGIPVLASDRAAAHARGEQIPVIIAGGIAISVNPLPLLPYMDFIFRYDAERSFKAFLDEFPRFMDPEVTLGAWWSSYKGPKTAIVPAFLLSEGRSLDDVLSGSACERENPPLDELAVPVVQDIPAIEDEDGDMPSLGNTFLLEVGRGCEQGCRFCLVGMHLRPPRFRSVSYIRQVLDKMAASGQEHEKVSLLGSNVSDHPDLAEVCLEILDNGFKLSIPSIKPTDEGGMVEIIQRANIKTITLAPETGSDRLRAAINKPFVNEDYERLARAFVTHDVGTIKVYLLYGLPTETEIDLDQTIEFLDRLRTIAETTGARIVASVNPFVPKLGTPFMFHAERYLGRNFKTFKRGFESFVDRVQKATHSRVGTTSPREARLQAALSLGGIELAPFLSGSGAGGKSIPERDMDAVFEAAIALKESGNVPVHIECLLPVPIAYLRSEWDRAIEGTKTPPCREDSCSACGARACPKHA